MPVDPPFRVLVICTGNRARSQMVHGWLGHLGGSRLEVESTGTRPKGVHPLAVQVMAESGIDTSGHTSGHVDRYAADDFDQVVAVRNTACEIAPCCRAQSACSATSSRTPTSPAWMRPH